MIHSALQNDWMSTIRYNATLLWHGCYTHRVSSSA